jgi:DTW domain-containing protein YfiP
MQSGVNPVGFTRRPVCAHCLRAQSACICQWCRPVPHAVDVVLLQHPLEVANAKGTARLLHMSLPHSRLVTGEVFDEATLQALLFAPFDLQDEAALPKQALLLYPDTPQDAAQGGSVPPALAPHLLRDPAQLRLIVLDGTWRKSRKMLYQNPLLQRLPRLALRDTPTSRYLIRKAHRPDQLSTLEATCVALAQLDGQAAPFVPLLAAFDGFVAQQLQRPGGAVRDRA